MGRHEYKSPRRDGIQQFDVTVELVAEFESMEQDQFRSYDEFNRNRVRGMFGSKDPWPISVIFSWNTIQPPLTTTARTP